jgi:hypothetical protein
MPHAKIQLSFGNFSFSGEGDDSWLSTQLDKVLEEVKALSKIQPPLLEPRNTPTEQKPASGDGEGFTETLAAYIKSKGGDSSQVVRFLATADWLRRRGHGTLSTAAVTKALSDNQQKRLGNAPDCLNKNVAKGYCEKTGNGFFITPDGLQSIGSQ